MLEENCGGPTGVAEEGAGSRAAGAAAGRCFKLQFAAQGEPGRSGLSAVRPLALPAPLTDKFYVRRCGGAAGAGGEARGEGEAEDAAVERALVRVRDRFSLGPRDKYPPPVTTSQEYGWYCGGAVGARGQHHIRDSSWLRTRLRLLAPDAAYKR